MAAKVTAASTRSGNQVARWVLRTWSMRSRVPDSSWRGSSPEKAVPLVMGNRLATQTLLRKKPVLPCRSSRSQRAVTAIWALLVWCVLPVLRQEAADAIDEVFGT
jgi:hypothetical protein